MPNSEVSGSDHSPGKPDPEQTLSSDSSAPQAGSGAAAAGAYAQGMVLAGRFRIARFLGRGGMGEVYEAEDLELHERVALKTIRRDMEEEERALERFRREIHLARKVTHPNVCRIFDMFRHEGVTFLSMELLVGETLGARLRQRGPMKGAEALPLVRQMTAALGAAHRAGIIHRDFKSSNVMLVADASEACGVRVVVTDFGLARAAQRESAAAATTAGDISLTGAMVGTPAYMAPEQVRGGEVTAATDIYSMGMVMYEMVTGRLPFRGETPLTAAVRRLEEAAESPRKHAPELEVEWERVILRCLEREPGARFGSAAEVAQALSGKAVAEAERPVGWRRLGWAGVVAAILLAVLVNVVPRWRERRDVQPSPGPAAGAVPTPAVKARRSVAVLGFKNLSGRSEAAWLSTALSEMFTTELAAGGRLRTISGENVARMKIELELREAESLAKDTLARVRANLGTDLVVLGSYVVLGGRQGQIRLDLQLQDAAVGETVTAVAESGSEQKLFEMVSRAGTRLREKLGVGELSAAEAVAVQASLPGNPEAARLYSDGLAKLRSFEARAARELLEKAVAAEPKHPLPHAALASAWQSLGYDQKAREEAKKAFDLSGGLSREQRLAVEGRYRETVQEWDKTIEIHRTLYRFFPDNLDYGLRLASALSSSGKGKEALATLESLKKLPAPARDDPRIDLEEAKAAASLSDFKKQHAASASATAKGRAQGSRLLLASARLHEGDALSRLGQPQPAAAAYDQARADYAAAGDRAGEARALNSAAVLLFGRGQLDEARRTAEGALAIFQKTGTKSGVAFSLNTIARILNAQGQFDAAKTFFERVLATNREVGNKLGQAVALNNIAVVLKGQGNLDGSKRMYGQALAVYREVGNKNGEAATLNNIAILLHDQGDLRSSKQTYEQALALYRHIGAKGGVAGTTYAMGRLLVAEDNLSAARKAYEQALALHNKVGADRSAAFSRLGLAAVSVEEGRAAEAEAPARAVAQKFQTEKSPDSEAFALGVVALSLLGQGKLAEAQAVIERAVKLAEKSPHILMPVSIIAARVYTANGKTQEATRMLQALQREAMKAGLVVYQLEIRLALAEAELKSGNATARARLEALAKDSVAKGFGLIARKAAAARK